MPIVAALSGWGGVFGGVGLSLCSPLSVSLCMLTVVFVFTCYSAQNDSSLLLPVSVLFWCTQNSDNGFYHFIFIVLNN